jgi:hypothetical protein
MKLTIKFYEIKQDLYEIFLFIKGKENYKYGRNKKKKRIRGRQHLPINSIEEFISIFNIARARRPDRNSRPNRAPKTYQWDV